MSVCVCVFVCAHVGVGVGKPGGKPSETKAWTQSKICGERVRWRRRGGGLLRVCVCVCIGGEGGALDGGLEQWQHQRNDNKSNS